MTCFFDRNIPHHQLFSLSSQSIVFLSLWWSCSFQSYKYSICAVLCCSLEKAMAPHSSTLAWKIPWMEEPGRLQSMGSLRGGHDWATSLALFTFMALEKEMATHSSVLAWRVPGTGEPGGLLSMGSHRVRHNWGDLAAAAAVVFLVTQSCLTLWQYGP